MAGLRSLGDALHAARRQGRPTPRLRGWLADAGAAHAVQHLDTRHAPDDVPSGALGPNCAAAVVA